MSEFATAPRLLYKYWPAMIAGRPLVARPGLRVIGTCLLLITLALALPLEASQLLHRHDAGSSAIYNGNCPLAAVAACHSVGLPVAISSPARVLVPAGVATLAPGARLFTPISRHTDPRAPPLV